MLKIRRRSGQSVVVYDKQIGQPIGRVIYRSGSLVFAGFDPATIGFVRDELVTEHKEQQPETATAGR